MNHDLIGYGAAVFTTSWMLPQVIKVFHTQDTKSISLLSLVMLGVGLILWTIFGVLTKNPPIFMANSIAGILILLLLMVKIYHMWFK